MNSVLMVAFHFPPLSGGSGIQRTLRFVQYLPEFGWQPLVLSAGKRAYAETSDDLMRQLPDGLVVRRAFALDASRHMAVRGRYLGWMARPDRWVSWKYSAVRLGMEMIRQYRPRAIWTTYPIATAHLIGAELQRRSGLPWIADFRDPMAQTNYPSDRATWQSFVAIERQVFSQASCCVFTTQSAAREYAQRYPTTTARLTVIENGYDESCFVSAAEYAQQLDVTVDRSAGRKIVLHSGIVYPAERDPTALFEALRDLLDAGSISSKTFCLRFRAPVHSALLFELAAKYGVEDVVEIAPPIPYREALAEMMGADALLLLQASDCNHQIPAKLYEYMRAGRPIIALTDRQGETATTLLSAGIDSIARLDSAKEIADCLARCLRELDLGTCRTPGAEVVGAASRHARTRCLAEVLNGVPPEKGYAASCWPSP